ncbi:hypothetical protein OQJ59_16430 [Microbulbifer thermotolerans]|uniref:hypothetical protein n=1 Tax=Microbulbifer thermotolerans TaxID=252514 RepID=UPI00224B9BB4|nr:hypothetical protein [Microbulbifer thermotolerans]MCX2843198.1 hypothetical protein [Microbulbifer thermotolerans]
MEFKSGATSIAEDKYESKTDVNLIFGNKTITRKYVLRTTLHSLPVWKARNANVNVTAYEDRTASVVKKAAIIDREIWVFEIDSTCSDDIVAAVKYASHYYDAPPELLLKNVYAKNLNAENIDDKNDEIKIRTNKDLYSNTCNAILQAAKTLGVSSQLNFYVFSKNNNPKIPQTELKGALLCGGARSVTTDDHKPKVYIGNNAGTDFIVQRTNFHLATLSP